MPACRPGVPDTSPYPYPPFLLPLPTPAPHPHAHTRPHSRTCPVAPAGFQTRSSSSGPPLPTGSSRCGGAPDGLSHAQGITSSAGSSSPSPAGCRRRPSWAAAAARSGGGRLMAGVEAGVGLGWVWIVITRSSWVSTVGQAGQQQLHAAAVIPAPCTRHPPPHTWWTRREPVLVCFSQPSVSTMFHVGTLSSSQWPRCRGVHVRSRVGERGGQCGGRPADQGCQDRSPSEFDWDLTG
eukprot:38006-Chlamydomonas_euryale.AAC.1